MEGSDVVIGLPNGIDQLMQDSFLLVDLFLADIALGNEVVVFSLVLEVCQIDFVHDSRVVFLEELHVADKILLVVLQDGLHSFLTALVLADDQLICFGLATREEGLELFVDEVGLVDGEEVLIFGLLIDYLASVGGVDAVLDLSDLQCQKLSLLFQFLVLYLRLLQGVLLQREFLLVFFSLLGDVEDFFLQLPYVLSELAVLLLDKLHLFVGLASKAIVDELVFDQDFILQEVLPQSLFFLVSNVFQLDQLFLQTLLDFDELCLLIVAILQFLHEEALLVLEEILPVDESLQLLSILGDVPFQFVVSAVQLLLFILQSQFSAGYFFLPHCTVLLTLDLYPSSVVDQVLFHQEVSGFEISEFDLQLCLDV